MNLICDFNGNSLAYQWDDNNKASKLWNYDFPNSTLRKALCGSGNGSHILAAQKGETVWSSQYSNKTILSMLPTSLQNSLKTVKKTVRVQEGYIQSDDCSDKLFLLSGKEIGYETELDEGSVYSYYKMHALDSFRVKQQINKDLFTGPKWVKELDKQTFAYSVECYAGHNLANDENHGNHYWLRSPQTARGGRAMCCGITGPISEGSVCAHAYGIAPAFCL